LRSRLLCKKERNEKEEEKTKEKEYFAISFMYHLPSFHESN
jgi:hypothetical protein